MPTAYDTWLEGDCGVDAREEAKAEEVAKLAAEYADDPAKLAEAEEWVAGSFDVSHERETTLALYDLHLVHPSDLLGTTTLATLYQLAKVVTGKMDAELERMAADELDKRERNDGPDHE